MTAEELSQVLAEQLDPIISQLQNTKEILVLFVVLFGVVIGALCAIQLWRRF